MLEKLKTWLLAAMSAIAGFFFVRARVAVRQKERTEKDLQLAEQNLQASARHSEKTLQALKENKEHRAQVEAQVATRKRDYFQQEK